MAVSSSLQQVSGGVASVIAGLIVTELPNKSLDHFDMLGYVIIGTTMVTIVMMYFIHKVVPEHR